MKTLTGTSLAGMSPTRERVTNDFYATPFNATEAILKREKLFGSILEPAAGQGHISKVLKEFYPYSEIVSTDLVVEIVLLELILLQTLIFLHIIINANLITLLPIHRSNLQKNLFFDHWN